MRLIQDFVSMADFMTATPEEVRALIRDMVALTIRPSKTTPKEALEFLKGVGTDVITATTIVTSLEKNSVH